MTELMKMFKTACSKYLPYKMSVINRFIFGFSRFSDPSNSIVNVCMVVQLIDQNESWLVRTIQNKQFAKYLVEVTSTTALNITGMASPIMPKFKQCSLCTIFQVHHQFEPDPTSRSRVISLTHRDRTRRATETTCHYLFCAGSLATNNGYINSHIPEMLFYYITTHAFILSVFDQKR